MPEVREPAAITRYTELAEEIRRVGENMRTEENRARMFRIAQSYESMAKAKRLTER